MKLKNLALAIMTGTAMSSLPKNMTTAVQQAINKCESLSSGKQLILHGNPSGIFHRIWQSFDVIFAEYAI